MKFASAVLAGASIVALSLAAASPAAAAGNAIDPGDSLYAVNCDDVYNDFQFFSVESTTAFSTPIGDGLGSVSEYACAGQPAYDPSTGKSYYIQWEEEGTFLAEIDVVTGVSATIGEFSWVNGEFPQTLDAYSIAIGSDGSAYLMAGSALWELNLETAQATLISEAINTYAFAYNSATDKFYAIDTDDTIYEIDVTTGGETAIGEVVFPDDMTSYTVYSLQFDQAGTFWIEVDHFSENDFFNAELWSFSPTGFEAPVFSGVFTDDPFYTEAILIVPGVVAPVEPALAATGADLADVLPWAIGGAVIVLAGGVLLILRSRRKPAAITTTEQAPAPEIESKD